MTPEARISNEKRPLSLGPRRVAGVFALLGALWLASTPSPAAPFGWSPDQVTVEARAAEGEFAAHGQLRIRTGGPQPGSVVLSPSRTKSWDMSAFQAIELTLRNTGRVRVVPRVTVMSPSDILPPRENGVENSLYLDPGETQKLLVHFKVTEKVLARLHPWLKGMRAGPNTPLLLWKGVDPSAIGSVTFSARDVPGQEGAQPGEYFVEDIRPVKFHEEFGYPAENQFPFIDTYGQFKQGRWPGKLVSEDEFPARIKAEQADLAAHPRPAQWNRWGGWAEGPKFPSTGYFHVRKVEGRWWLIDPEGCLFWSHGATGVARATSVTVVSGRESYFEPPPAPGTALHRFAGRRGKDVTYDFYAANLYRKYGDNFLEETTENAYRRLASWGMNTYGNWSRGYEQPRTPFTVPVHTSSPELGTKLPDVWHPAFEAGLRRSLGMMKADEVTSSPWNLGFFIYNEIRFRKPQDLAGAMLAAPADQPATVAWVERLWAKYGRIESLNQAWRTQYPSWNHLLTSTEKVPYASMAADAGECFTEYCDRFFRISREACKEYFPNHLYLGSRLHGDEHPVVMKAAATYCDVISYNIYRKTLAGWTGPIPDLQRPVMSTEFHFGALDRGMFHTGLQGASSQEDRAEHYYEYVRSALRNPLFVGTHWFQYAPQSFTGREDGENYQIGLLDIADTPYPEIIRAVRRIGAEMYESRYRGNAHAAPIPEAP
jgi:hypothetical protein